uniref:tRNA-5-taurinomethyluridine 2-sulfurtransferase n=1 Tax=Spongospora subterranea TaxID=70186 RepID=A0A0H5QJC6_9EUKA|eukprot:CRZ02103.1 hypothetical protein [Spongospora subterranea]
MLRHRLRNRWSDFRNIHTVAVGISGGVDSSASAVLLKREGYNVIGVHMTNWSHDIEDGNQCEGRRDAEIAEEVCRQLRIPFHRVAFQKEYWSSVFTEFITGLQQGFTPNPDVTCNAKVKFSLFRQYCTDELGAHSVATGHFARIFPGPTLVRGADTSVDQSYFLAQVPRQNFTNVLFPVGHLSKAAVREVAIQEKLITANRPTSTGLCFVGKRRRFPEFLRQFVAETPGRFVDADGRPIGRQHQGQMFYTIGQRARISGLTEAHFVSRKDGDNIHVVPGRSHPDLFCETIICSHLNWIDGDLPAEVDTRDGFQCLLSVRYRSELGRCSLRRLSDGRFEVAMRDLHRAVTPGQTSVFYSSTGVCFGSAFVDETGPSLYAQGRSVPIGCSGDLIIRP